MGILVILAIQVIMNCLSPDQSFELEQYSEKQNLYQEQLQREAEYKVISINKRPDLFFFVKKFK